ncbi:hypothetical protein A2U01_0080472, partial [Trifolium medium]|nr:hypothetical protein [Trifolium medium]
EITVETRRGLRKASTLEIGHMGLLPLDSRGGYGGVDGFPISVG